MRTIIRVSSLIIVRDLSRSTLRENRRTTNLVTICPCVIGQLLMVGRRFCKIGSVCNPSYRFRRKMMPRFARRSFRRRPRQNWQWVRETANNSGSVVPPGNYTQDLLTSFRNVFGVSANWPDIVVWRIRIRVSVSITFPATIVNPEAFGMVVAVFVDDAAFSLKSPSVDFYYEKFMLFE